MNDDTNTPLPTEFAPADRHTKDEMQAEAEIVEEQVFSSPFMQQVINASREMILILDENRQIIFANQSFLNYVDCSNLNSIRGKRYGEAMLCVSARNESGGCGTAQECSACDSVPAVLSALEGKHDKKEFSIFREDLTRGSVYLIRTYPLIVDGKHWVLCSLSDIGHQKRRQMLERVFFHDIANAAQGLLGHAYALKSGTAKNLQQTYERNMMAVKRLIEEIDDQHRLALAEEEELNVAPVTTQTLPLIKEVIDSLEDDSIAMDKQMVIAENVTDVSFVSDGKLVSRVLANMLKNALEATPKGGTVTIGCTADDTGVTFSVHNEGEVPEEARAQLFNRAFSTKGEGHGWGAYSMKLITEQYLNGEVSYTSSAEEGTTFKARYPLKI